MRLPLAIFLVLAAAASTVNAAIQLDIADNPPVAPVLAVPTTGSVAIDVTAVDPDTEIVDFTIDFSVAGPAGFTLTAATLNSTTAAALSQPTDFFFSNNGGGSYTASAFFLLATPTVTPGTFLTLSYSVDPGALGTWEITGEVPPDTWSDATFNNTFPVQVTAGSVTVIPEPAGAAALALIGVAIAARRRRAA